MITNRDFKPDKKEKPKKNKEPPWVPPMCKGCQKYRCEWDKNCIPKIKEIISEYPEGFEERKKWEEIIRNIEMLSM